MSLALRHQPDAIGIQLDEEGWVNTNELINGVNNKGINLDIEGLKILVEENDKKRFAFNEDKSKIRAKQGHSVDVDLKLGGKMKISELFSKPKLVENYAKILDDFIKTAEN